MNGQARELNGVAEGSSLATVVAALELKADRVAVEWNGEIVGRRRWDEVRVASGDKLEVVHFVGGGAGAGSSPVSAVGASKSYTEYLTYTTRKRYEMVHMTDEVEAIVRRSGVVDGLCFVSPMHITAAIYVNDHESGLIEDISTWLEELAPSWPGYKHHQTGEDNADAHLKALLLHHETTLPVTRGRLDLGTWQRVFYAEFDGQRTKRVIVKVMGITGGAQGSLDR